MSEDILVTIKGNRGSPPALTTIANNVVVQLDKMQAVEAAGYESSEPHFTYTAYTTQLPVSDPQLLREGDLLIDTKTIDYTTNSLRQYRVIAEPESYPDFHWELICYRFRGH